MLADLVARRRQVIDMLVAERQRASGEPRPGEAFAGATDRGTGEGTAEIDQEIDDGVRGSPAWCEAEDLLASVPGVGSITART